MNRVTIRTKKKCKGTMLSVFLEYNPVFIPSIASSTYFSRRSQV